ncbi:GNAT family N-acetyltransferase [uncultured Streptomyces sp.]|uniref:GNAT family N-acetyltransferase n=1 Tax=uncultured Streptomyces sp. TaxID=174707 RepID=UPI002638C8DB|nr:GNAT family protein [uncultured Streptomyces sp.]
MIPTPTGHGHDAPRDADGEPHDAARVPCRHGRNISLAPLELEDAELLRRWRSDPAAALEVGAWPSSLHMMSERVERYLADDDRDDFLVLLPDGTPVGHAALVEENLSDGTAEAYLLLDAAHRGRGVGASALDALVDLAFGDLPLHRVEALTHTGNRPALSVLGRSGFVREGVRRSACLHRGRRYDQAVLSLLRPEWEALARPRSWEHPPPS